MPVFDLIPELPLATEHDQSSAGSGNNACNCGEHRLWTIEMGHEEI